MEKRYYFRGLGLGIIVTAVIMGIALSGGKKEKMTDAEIMARAKELGMVEDSTLLETAGEEAADGADGTEAVPVEKEETVKKDISVAKQKEEAEQKEKTEEEPGQAQEEEKPTVGTPESLEEKEKKAAESEAAEAKPEETAEAGKTETADRKTPGSTNEMTKQDEDVPEPETESAADGVKRVTIVSGDGSYTVARKLAEAGAVSSADAYDDFLCANGYDKKLRTGTFEIPAHANDEQVARIVTGQE